MTLERRDRSWLERAIGWVSPKAELKRLIARDLVLRHYEAAAAGYRTDTWFRRSTDANAANDGVSLQRLRDLARDLTRNDGQMGSVLRTIANHTVGWGIVAKSPEIPEALRLKWQAWAGTTACDADGRDDLYGLQKLVIRGVAQSGEMLVRRRFRRIEDRLPIPLQLQVLEPDHLDTSKTHALGGGREVVQGVEFDTLGRRVAYWLFPKHPGAMTLSGSSMVTGSVRVPASEILHVYERERAGQVRAASWFSPVIGKANDVGDYGDATRMKQKIAACLAIITSDPEGTATPVGTADDQTSPGVDRVSPGAVLNMPPGRTVSTLDPPSVSEHESFMNVELHALAKGARVSYEDFTGDYSKVNFSSARMARIAHYEDVHDWRWRLLIPQFCDPAWRWAMEAATALEPSGTIPVASWTPPPIPMLEPDKEGLAVMRNVRTGIQTLFDAIRERGYDPDEFLAEYAAGLKKLDDLGIILDSDARYITQFGQTQPTLLKDDAKPPVPTGGSA